MKKNIIITVLVLILIVVLEVVISSKTNEKEKDFDTKEAKVLVNQYFTDEYIPTSNVFNDGMNDRYKIGLSLFYYEKDLTEYDCNELYPESERDDEGIVVGNGTFCDGKVKGISYNDLNKSYKKLFGNSSDLEKKTVGVYNYIKDKDTFVILSCRCGGATQTRYLRDVKEATIKGNTLKVKVYYFEYVPEEGKENEEIDEAKVLEENKSKATIYEMKFKKEDKVFKLISVKKVS